ALEVRYRMRGLGARQRRPASITASATIKGSACAAGLGRARRRRIVIVPIRCPGLARNLPGATATAGHRLRRATACNEVHGAAAAAAPDLPRCYVQIDRVSRVKRGSTVLCMIPCDRAAAATAL